MIADGVVEGYSLEAMGMSIIEKYRAPVFRVAMGIM